MRKPNHMVSRPVPLLFVLFGLLYALGVFWGMPSALGPALDSISPLGPLAFVAKFGQADISYVYPAVHQLVQVAAYAIVLAGAKLTGALGAVSSVWPYGFRDPSAMFTVLLVVSNLISTAMAALLLRSLWRMRPSPDAAQWFAIPLLGLSGIFAFYARTANMDIPYLFWAVLAWREMWIYLTPGEPPRSRRLWCAGLFSALSVGSKDQASGLVLGFGLLLLAVTPDGEGGWNRRLRQAAIFSTAMVLFYTLFAIVPQPARWWYHARFVTSDHVLAETPATLAGYMELLERSYWRLHHIFTHAGFPLALAGIFLLWRRNHIRELILLLVPPMAYFLFIIARVRATEERYLLPVAIPLILCAGVAVGAMRQWAWARKPALALGISVLTLQAVFSFWPVTYCQIWDTKRAMVREIGAIVPHGSAIALHGMQTFNYPSQRVYDRYRLMLAPGGSIVPPSSHAASLLHRYAPPVRYVLTGRPDPPPHGQWVLVAAWTYPAWIKSHVHVPAVHELFLYQNP
jgi:hypothetical protein